MVYDSMLIDRHRNCFSFKTFAYSDFSILTLSYTYAYTFMTQLRPVAKTDFTQIHIKCPTNIIYVCKH